MRIRLPSSLLLGSTMAILFACGITQPKYIDYTDGDGQTDGQTDGKTDGQTDGQTDGAPAGTTYNGQIKALVDKNCAYGTCHVAGKQSPDLSTYSGAKANSARGKIRIEAGTMPPGGKLKQADIDLYDAWVAAGTPQ